MEASMAELTSRKRTALSSSLAAVLSDNALVRSCEPDPNGSSTYVVQAFRVAFEYQCPDLRRTDFVFGHRLVHACATTGLLNNDHLSLSLLVPQFPMDRFELDRVAATAQDEGLSIEVGPPFQVK